MQVIGTRHAGNSERKSRESMLLAYLNDDDDDGDGEEEEEEEEDAWKASSFYSISKCLSLFFISKMPKYFSIKAVTIIKFSRRLSLPEATCILFSKFSKGIKNYLLYQFIMKINDKGA